MSTGVSKNLRIGIFDSGVGGFSVLLSLFSSFPKASYFYLADKAYAPYGNLPDQELLERTQFGLDVLTEKSCDLVVIACNTATAWAIDRLREKTNIPLVGVEPYINVINQRSDLNGKKVALLVTPQMAKSERLKKLLKEKDSAGSVEIKPMPSLAKEIESFYLKGEVDDSVLTKELSGLEKYDTLILGCTHYPLIRKSIEKVTGTEAICPADAVAKRVQELLTNMGADSCREDIFNYCETPQLEWMKLERASLQQWPK